MRVAITLIEGANGLTEGRVMQIELDRFFGARQTVSVYSKPSRQQIMGLCQQNFAMDGESNLRGFADGKHCYVWPAEEATHTGVQRALGLEADDSFDYYRRVANFHLRGYGWQEGDPSETRNRLVLNGGPLALIEPWARRWGCSVDQDGNGYY